MLRPSGVSSASEASCAASASVRSSTPRAGIKSDAAVAERDSAGFIQQQHVDIARGFYGAAAGGDDVRAQHSAHSGYANGGE